MVCPRSERHSPRAAPRSVRSLFVPVPLPSVPSVEIATGPAEDGQRPQPGDGTAGQSRQWAATAPAGSTHRRGRPVAAPFRGRRAFAFGRHRVCGSRCAVRRYIHGLRFTDAKAIRGIYTYLGKPKTTMMERAAIRGLFPGSERTGALAAPTDRLRHATLGIVLTITLVVFSLFGQSTSPGAMDAVVSLSVCASAIACMFQTIESVAASTVQIGRRSRAALPTPVVPGLSVLVIFAEERPDA